MNLASVLVSSCAQLLWPARCAGCDVILKTDRAVFCSVCTESLNPLMLACPTCALPQTGQPGWSWAARRCVECARRGFAFSRAFAGFEYGAALAAAVVRMKHGGRSDLARRLGRLLAPVLRAALAPDGDGDGDGKGGKGDVHARGPSRWIDAVIPVPLHPRKLRRRGFNQALLLARAALAAMPEGRMLRLSPIPVPVPRPRLERHLLLRIRHTRELGRWGPNVRRVEVAGAFRVSDPARVAKKRFLLVDDVMTTGATLNECAETLMHAGASEVRVVALARAV